MERPNTEYLQAEIVQVVTTDEDNSLPEIHVELIKEDKSDEDNQEQDVLVTHFRAINETNSQRRSSTKFERINKEDSESSDDDTDTTE